MVTKTEPAKMFVREDSHFTLIYDEIKAKVIVKCVNISDSKSIIDDVEYLLGEMAEGNFEVSSKSYDSYVGDFQSLITAMRKLKYQMSGTLNQIRSSSEQVMVGADQLAVDANGVEQAVQRLVVERVEAHLLADRAQHAAAALGVAVHVLVEVLLALGSLELEHLATRDELVVGPAA